MNTEPKQFFLIDAHDFNGKVISTVEDGRVAFSGYLHNNGGPNLTVEEYLAHSENHHLVDPRVVEWDELEGMIKEANRRLFTDKPAVEVSESRYDEMMGAVPPERIGKERGMAYFIAGERITGSIAQMCAESEGRYLAKAVDVFDKTTWITPKDFALISQH